MQLDPDQFADIVANAIKVAIAPLVARITVLERREAVPGPEGKPGRDGDAGPPGESVMGPTGPKGEPGQDADEAVITALETKILVLHDAIAMKEATIKSWLLSEVAAMPLPQNGKDGQDGASVTVEDVAPLVKTLVTEAVAALPAPKDGAPGESVDLVALAETLDTLAAKHVASVLADFPMPKDGQSVTVEDVAPLIASEVQKAVAAIPVPKDGRDGKDGVGVMDAFQSREGTLIITLSDGTTKDVGPVVGRDVDMVEVTRQIREAIAAIPVPKDGRDGVGFDDLEMVEDDRGRPILRFRRADWTREFRIDGAYCGIWKDGEAYLKGDRVTWSGSLFIAKQDTTDKPGLTTAWQLSVKHGKEGKPGPEGQKGLDGRHGRDGKDLTYLDPSTGRKY